MQVQLNGKTHETADAASVAEILRGLEMDPRQCAVEVNEQIVPRGEHAAYRLQAGDRVEIVTLVGGG